MIRRSERMMADARSQPPLTIVSPSGGTRWRVLPNGVVQRTIDGGSTWEAQDIGVDVAPTAGASPSPLVCWLVGPRGLVLLSIDGRSWKRAAVPDQTANLTAVRAVDDKTASVTAADGRTFQTNDGGVTWTKL